MKMFKRRIIIFYESPFAFSPKTKDQQQKAQEGIKELSQEMFGSVLKTARSAALLESAALDIKLDVNNNGSFKQTFNSEDTVSSKKGQDTAAQTKNAFLDNFKPKTNRVVLIKPNCPSLTVYHIRKAFALLKNFDVVLGPTKNNNYYLLGFKRMIPELFDAISSDDFQTIGTVILKEADKMALNTVQLGALPEIISPEELFHWTNVQQQTVSVIISTKNDAKNIGHTLERVKALNQNEVIVVNGQSADKTIDYARQWGAEILSSDPNRSRQMNMGAEQAEGDILLFISPNALLPVNYEDHIRQILSVPEYMGGYFSFSYKSKSLKNRIREKMIRLRNVVLRLPINEQPVFVRKSIFNELNGFSEQSKRETVEFMRRLKKAGRVIRLKVPFFWLK